ncbi:hypothetical protein SSS_01966 [Sarcoptes scabiei]|uniref:Uncharacterized protein n=1 Tax=Sarcoptes scabiei TaxID=52283 RepID=A0A834VGM8_SARSC|nr:hypothetical protein SSS_01966 [Sarcoptes scabiei]
MQTKTKPSVVPLLSKGLLVSKSEKKSIKSLRNVSSPKSKRITHLKEMKKKILTIKKSPIKPKSTKTATTIRVSLESVPKKFPIRSQPVVLIKPSGDRDSLYFRSPADLGDISLLSVPFNAFISEKKLHQYDRNKLDEMIEIKPHFRLPPPTSSSAYNLVVAKQKTFQTDDKITNNGIDPSKFKVFKFYEKIKFKKIDQSVPSIVTVPEVKDKFDPTIPERQNQINEKAILSATITKKLSEKNGKLLGDCEPKISPKLSLKYRSPKKSLRFKQNHSPKLLSYHRKQPIPIRDQSITYPILPDSEKLLMKADGGGVSIDSTTTLKKAPKTISIHGFYEPKIVPQTDSETKIIKTEVAKSSREDRSHSTLPYSHPHLHHCLSHDDHLLHHHHHHLHHQKHSPKIHLQSFANNEKGSSESGGKDEIDHEMVHLIMQHLKSSEKASFIAPESLKHLAKGKIENFSPNYSSQKKTFPIQCNGTSLTEDHSLSHHNQQQQKNIDSINPLGPKSLTTTMGTNSLTTNNQPSLQWGKAQKNLLFPFADDESSSKRWGRTSLNDYVSKNNLHSKNDIIDANSLEQYYQKRVERINEQQSSRSSLMKKNDTKMFHLEQNPNILPAMNESKVLKDNNIVVSKSMQPFKMNQSSFLSNGEFNHLQQQQRYYQLKKFPQPMMRTLMDKKNLMNLKMLMEIIEILLELEKLFRNDSMKLTHQLRHLLR